MNRLITTLACAASLAAVSACTAITDVTSSTSSTTDTVTPDVTLNNFIDRRYDAIRKDAARGGGENIEALASLLGTRDSDALAAWMQAHYQDLFGTGHRPAELRARIEQYRLVDRG